MFSPAMPFDDLWSGEITSLNLSGREILLFRANDSVHAYEDRCLHLGVPLSRGKLTGTVLTCFAHQWQYDLATGRGVNPDTVCLKAYEVKIENGIICVRVPEGL